MGTRLSADTEAILQYDQAQPFSCFSNADGVPIEKELGRVLARARSRHTRERLESEGLDEPEPQELEDRRNRERERQQQWKKVWDEVKLIPGMLLSENSSSCQLQPCSHRRCRAIY